MITTLVLILLSLLILLIVSGVEYAYLASNELNVELKRKKGSTGGMLAASFFDRPERFWSATVITFYIILVITCFLISKTTIWLVTNFVPKQYIAFYESNPFIGMLIDILIATMLIINITGIISKTIFERKPENKLTRWSLFVNIIANITHPIHLAFTNLSQFVLKYLFNIRIKEANKVFEKVNVEDFVYHSIQGHSDFESKNKELFEKTLRLSKLRVRNCITPRNEIVAIDINAPILMLKEKFIKTKQSRIVVFEDTLDNIVGYTHQIDLNKRPSSIREIMIEIPVVPETTIALDMMNKFSKEGKSIAWVIDEFGGTAGFTTMEAVLEEVFGNLKDETNIEDFTERVLSDNEFIFSGRLEINYLNQKYKLNIPNNIAQTLSGYIVSSHTSIPHLRERIVLDNFEFDILLVTATRVETVKLKVLNF